MILIFLSAAIVATAFFLRLGFYLRALGGQKVTELPVVDGDQYRPMLRLLSDGDLRFMSADRRAGARRRTLFREYLRELTDDYGKLLAGVRLVMVGSAVERPDLARILVVNRLSFAMAACRLEIYLLLHSFGVMNSAILELEIFGLVDSVHLLRRLFPVESAVWGA